MLAINCTKLCCCFLACTLSAPLGQHQIFAAYNVCFLDIQDGSIVFISSYTAYVAVAPIALYAISKTTLLALTKALAEELGHTGVRVNCVAPGIDINHLVVSSKKRQMHCLFSMPCDLADGCLSRH